jgi:hypothetical protein
MYFPFRGLPSASPSTAVATRCVRVSSRLASAIHSQYSRCWLGLNASNVARARRFLASAAASASGTTTVRGALGFERAGDFTPASFSSMAFFT